MGQITRAISGVFALLPCTDVQAERRTYANPIDIDYRYNWEQANDGISYRTGADPAIVKHQGHYYLFETLADGYWMSDNLVDWTFIKPNIWPSRGIVAPALWSDGKRIYMMPATMEPGPIYVSEHPETGQLQYLTRRMFDLPGMAPPGKEDRIQPGQVPPGPWDPALFKDDDGRWYLYWDSSNEFPIYGIELDPARRMAYVGAPKPLLTIDPARHGWERFGQDHNGLLADGRPTKPYVEGSWMTKIGGRYYLQYAAPGTEFNAYANGAYLGTSPLGPFSYAPYNPVAYKPGGFVEGAGHGSTVEDNYGNWWNSGTPWIGYNWTFERRIALFPVKIYPDGQMAASTRFGDFPHYMPRSKVDDPERLFTGWMLLSYKKRAVSSSTLGEFGADRVTDENPRTFWVAANNSPGQTLTVDLGAMDTVRAIQVNFADYKSGRFEDAPDIYTEFTLQASSDGQHWQDVGRTEAPRRDRPNAYFELPNPVHAHFIRYVHGHVGAANLAISDIRVFGNADVPRPGTPSRVAASRHPDQRDATIRWTKVPGAVGYNIRFGIRPDRLTLTHQIWFDEAGDGSSAQKELRSLNVGTRYWVGIEAFNENGVSKLSQIVQIR
jgi:xylan 1,4-beta-xylosidase